MSEDPQALELRRLLKRLAQTYGQDPDPEILDDDEEFWRALELAAALPFPQLASLASNRASTTKAVAYVAIARRGEPDERWVAKRIRQIGRVAPVEAVLILGALAEARESVVARVLAQVDHDWLYDPVLRAVATFLQRRVEWGERIRAQDFDAAQLKPESESLLDQLLEALSSAAPAELAEAVGDWRRGRIDAGFFDSIGRIWEVDDAAEATVVGPRAPALDAIVDALSRPRPRSLLVIGEHGVGKSTLIAEAVRRLRPRGWTVFEAGAAAVNAGQSFVGQLEGRIAEIASRTAGRSILWVFPRLDEALWSGQHNRSPQGLLDALLPHVDAGRIVLLGEIEPPAYELLVRLRPQVATTLEPVRLRPLDESETVQVARAWFGHRGVSAPAAETLGEAYELASHYLPGVAAPGNALRLLRGTRERLARQDGGEVTTAALLETLSDATGLPLHVLDPRRPLRIDGVRRFFTERVLGQPEAVDCLVERIALAKAGLTDPTRPLGVFLFVGPTGTGKTELAKGLAEYLFGSPDRLVRVDLSEYKTPESFERLLADTPQAARGASLIASVLEQPFSVVLLDEFEKAHPNIWDLFLQLFDDGRLTGQSGRTADFRHCVIILTSNVGSAIASASGPGFVRTGAAFNPDAVERAVQQTFRPELVNRLDRVVVFRPLDRDSMRTLLRLELADVLSRRGLRMQPWAVEWDETAVDFLLEQGFSADLGARPLKRAVERLLLVPLALAIVERQVPEGDQFLFITARNGRGIEVSFIDPDADAGPPPSAPAGPYAVEQLALEPRGEEGEVAFLADELGRLEARLAPWRERKREALEATREPGFWDDPAQDSLSTIEYLDRLEAAHRTAQGLLARLSQRSGRGQTPPAKRLVSLLAERLYLLARACDGLETGQPADAVVELATLPKDGDDGQFVERLRAMYASWAERRGMRFEIENGTLAVSGLGAYTILAPEHGLHVLETPRDERSFSRQTVRVSISPAGRLAQSSRTIVWRYREKPSPLVRDAVRGWRTGRLDRVLAGDFDLLGPTSG